MAQQVSNATIVNGPGYQTLLIDGEPFPYVIEQPITVISDPNNPDIDHIVVTIPTLSKVEYE